MQNRLAIPLSQENPLWISWHDTNWIPILNPTNVMDYFQEKTNPFYDRTCNNEIVKMQRLSLDQMNNMVGLEYILLHVQGPILYVIRKQHRHSPNDVTPIADYYIIAGTVYQAPDLASVFNSRLLSVTHHLQCSFEEASSYSRYHPNKGYSWDFSSNKAVAEKNKQQTKKETEKTKSEPSSYFQRQRVDMLLGELLHKFPLPMPPQMQAQHMQQQQQQSLTAPQSSQNNGSIAVASNAAPVNAGANANAATKMMLKSEPTETADERSPAVEIKQEIDMSPGAGGSIGNTGDNGIDIQQNIKLEPNEMKPPPEKKIKL